MNLTPNQQLHGFVMSTAESLPEIDGEAFVLYHKQSGAKLLYLKNDDVNKAFSITFKTPPVNDTGVFHILEHSVLCGSRKFPVKEPFVNLLKSSMQTFLNAMTFPDKTMYPVASTNDQDLLNLTDVYMDAVLHPLIYEKPSIFKQEGWHLELDHSASKASLDAPHTSAEDSSQAQLRFNGVVYNEMKGALSDPDSVLYAALQAALFPDTAYRFESGGTPQAIIDLSYEQFIEEHARHYRLDNSFIILYGNLDVEAMLTFLDTKYLTPCAHEQRQRDAQRTQAGQEALSPHVLQAQAPVKVWGITKTMVTAPENACIGLGYVVGDASERTRLIATSILLDALMGSNEAPLKRALLDAQFADDAVAFMDPSCLQPFAVIELKGLHDPAQDAFRSLVTKTLTELAQGGLDHALLEASLSHAEFIMREHNFGVADGVALSISALSGWLYGDELATSHLRYEDDFAFLRRCLDTDYFKELITTIFLDNNHQAEVELKPVEVKDCDSASEKLKQLAAAMSTADFERVAAEEEELRNLQTAPDDPKDLACLPHLSLNDIADTPKEPAYELQTDRAQPCLRHQVPTHGIAYTYRYFSLERISFEELPYVGILELVLGNLDTDLHRASELDTLVNGKLGNLAFFTEVYQDDSDPDVIYPQFVVGASALTKNAEYLGSLPREVLLSTHFSDTKKIKDMLLQRRIAMEQEFSAAGHASALARLSSYYHRGGVVREQLGGVEFYRFIKDLLAHFDERSQALVEHLQSIATHLFVDNALTLSFTGSDDAYEQFWASGALLDRVSHSNEVRLMVPTPVIGNEAFIVPGDVSYTATGLALTKDCPAYTGAWQVAARALSFDYLWNEVRVKGGAYGAGFQASRSGDLRFYSFRDPRLDATLERFYQAPAWLATFDPTPKEREGYVLSTVAGFDSPLKARMLIRRQDGDWFAKRTPKSREKTRSEMIACTTSTLQALADPLTKATKGTAVCVFGNADTIKGAHTPLHIVDLLAE